VLARRLPASYTAYAAVALLLALTGSNISSFDRYVFSTFPFVIGIAILTSKPVIEKVTVAVAAGALVVYSGLAFFHLYVP
jgi:hypothetical protein